MAVVTWNSVAAVPSGNWVLTDGGATAEESTSSDAQIRTDQPLSSTEKVYLELVLSSSSTFDCFVGLSRSDTNPGSLINGANTVHWRSNGGTFANGVTVNSGLSFNSGDTLMLAFDRGAGKVWIGKNGTWAGSGDPANGTNPTAQGIGSGNWLIDFCSDNNSGNHKVVGHFSSGSFAYTKPSGFGPYGIIFELSGTVLDSSGAPVARTVRAYIRSSGSISASGVSASDGTFSLLVSDAGAHYVIALDTSENAVVKDHVIPVEVS